MEPVCVTLKEYPQIIQSILKDITVVSETATVLALHGDLGVGKTTFTQILAAELGVTDFVTSPTFVIQKIYPTRDKRWGRLVHIDAYRLDGFDNIEPLRLTDLWNEPTNLVVIEWPERIASHVPKQAIHIQFSVVDEFTRRVEIITDQYNMTI